MNQARAIPRLNVPAYDWWSEALHGVAVDGTTEFPEPVGLAATFDTPRIHEMAVAISMEARIVHAQAWHTFRHTFSTLFKGNGEDVKVVQELLRHSTAKMTLDTYTQALRNL